MDIKDKDIPHSIQIDNYQYSFKQIKANNKFAYRCKVRRCGVIISIDAENLCKIINEINEGNFEYDKISKKEHICDKNTCIIEKSKVQSNTTMLELVEKLINQNLDKSKLWHYNNLIKIK